MCYLMWFFYYFYLKMKYVLAVIMFFYFSSSWGQEIRPFEIYNSKGKKVKTASFLKKTTQGDIVLFGELHNNPIAHWFELILAEHLYKNGSLNMGAEMFESDQQIVLNRFLLDEITAKEMDSLIKLWSNYDTDYRPLVEFAKDHKIPFIATNIPRKYASQVYREGLEALESDLTPEEKQLVAPLPIQYDPELPGYKAMLNMFGDAAHANPNFPKAQAIKDATMAHFIYTQWIKDKVPFLHFNGEYHSKNYEGIYWYLKQLNSNLKIVTISTIEQENIKQLEKENRYRADWIIVVDQRMTKTY